MAREPAITALRLPRSSAGAGVRRGMGSVARALVGLGAV
jgi:hypothetical protein